MRRIDLAVVLTLSSLVSLALSQPARQVHRIGIVSSIYATSDMLGLQPSSPVSTRSCVDYAISAMCTESIS